MRYPQHEKSQYTFDNESKFDQSDYDCNKEKYKLFRTAVMSEDVGGLKKEQFVSIKYFAEAIQDPTKNKTMSPVYAVRAKEGSEVNFLYGKALKRFCL